MKPILIIIMLTLIPSALAIYGGENWTKHFDKCDKLRVNVTGYLIIDYQEYIINNDCYNISNNYWICNCSNGFDFNISFKPNAINNYTFKFNYDYSDEEVEETTTSSGGGGSSGGSRRTSITNWDCQRWSECKNGDSTRYCYNDFGIKSTETRNCTVEKKTSPAIENVIVEEEITQEDAIGENITVSEENATGAIPQSIKRPISPVFIIIIIIIVVFYFGYIIYAQSKVNEAN